MYGDIIPPKKKYLHTNHMQDVPVHFTPIRQSAVRSKNKKIPFLFFCIALIAVGFGVYHKVYNGTVLRITPKTTRFEIQQKIPLVLQSREKDALTYSLVYIPETGSSTRNPFVLDATSTPKVSSDSITITASSTGDTKRIRLINKTSETVLLRVETRFDVKGVTYTLDAAASIEPTAKNILDTLSTTTVVYKVIGFKNSPSYDTVYAVLDSTKSNPESNTSSPDAISSVESPSTVPPQDILALMPDGAIPLQKSTVYDKLLDQSAVVVFDNRTLEDFLNASNIQIQDYFKVLKSFGPSVTYDIAIVDYTLLISPENGKPVAFSSLSIEITPKIDKQSVPAQFTGFKKETMAKIQKQVSEYMVFDVSYTPFWANSVAVEDRVEVR